jgi:hypothetical protein
MAALDRPSYADTVMAGVRIRRKPDGVGPGPRTDISSATVSASIGAVMSSSSHDVSSSLRTDLMLNSHSSSHGHAGPSQQELQASTFDQLAEVAVQKALAKALDIEVKKVVGPAVATEVKRAVASAVGAEIRESVTAAVAAAMEPALKYLIDRFLAATNQASAAGSISAEAPPPPGAVSSSLGSTAGSPSDSNTVSPQ